MFMSTSLPSVSGAHAPGFSPMALDALSELTLPLLEGAEGYTRRLSTGLRESEMAETKTGLVHQVNHAHQHASHAEHEHGMPSGHAHDGHDPSAQQASNLVKDPVCGMSVDPHTAKHRAEHAGRAYYFCSAGCRTKFLADPAHISSPLPAAKAEARPGGHDLHLPDAPRDPAGRARLLPDLRHGAGAACSRPPRPGPNPELDRHDAAVLDRAGADRAGVRARDGRPPARPRISSSSQQTVELDPVRCWRRRSCCGPAGRSSSAAGSRSSPATSTCSP